jgi:hypothetical protein
MIYCFGDSWGYGSELDLSYEKPFINLISEDLDIPFINKSVEGSSFGHITHEIFNYNTFTNNDLVLVIVPPDIRWYFENINNNISTLMVPNEDFLTDKTIDVVRKSELTLYVNTITHRKIWYEYHQSLFLFSLQEFFKQNGIHFLFIHNYGELKIYKPFNDLLLRENFLNFERSLTSLLTNLGDINLMDKQLDGPYKDMFVGEFFEGKGYHPNQLGHQEIKNIILKNKKIKEWYQLIMNGENLER